MAEQYPEELKYSENHNWVRVVNDGNYVFIGVTNYVSNYYGELSYAELPELEIEIDANEEVGVLEMANGNYELFSPVSGEIIAINDDLNDSLKNLSIDPFGDGWIYKVRLNNLAELDYLMTAEEYQDFLNNM